MIGKASVWLESLQTFFGSPARHTPSGKTQAVTLPGVVSPNAVSQQGSIWDSLGGDGRYSAGIAEKKFSLFRF